MDEMDTPFIIHTIQESSNCCRKIAPTILLDAPEDSLIMNEEIFGPLLPIVTVKFWQAKWNVFLLFYLFKLLNKKWEKFIADC